MIASLISSETLVAEDIIEIGFYHTTATVHVTSETNVTRLSISIIASFLDIFLLLANMHIVTKKLHISINNLFITITIKIIGNKIHISFLEKILIPPRKPMQRNFRRRD